MSNAHYWLSEEQFSKLEPHLPSDTRGVPRVDDRRVISGIVHVLKTGGRWVDARETYGPRKTLYNRFVRWPDRGIWTEHLVLLRHKAPVSAGALVRVRLFSASPAFAADAGKFA